jgi:hypothetical protein
MPKIADDLPAQGREPLSTAKPPKRDAPGSGNALSKLRPPASRTRRRGYCGGRRPCNLPDLQRPPMAAATGIPQDRQSFMLYKAKLLIECVRIPRSAVAHRRPRRSCRRRLLCPTLAPTSPDAGHERPDSNLTVVRQFGAGRSPECMARSGIRKRQIYWRWSGRPGQWRRQGKVD